MNGQAPAGGDVVFAGFWRRAGAFVLDSVILTIGFYLVVIIAVVATVAGGMGDIWDSEAPSPWVVAAYLVMVPGWFVVAAAYYALQESSPHQATIGKRALGIKVTDVQGHRLTRLGALKRWFASALSYLTLYVGFLIAAFTPQKQALHDLAAGTLVVDRWAYSGHEERQQRHVGALALILSLVLVVIPIIAILAAIAIPAYQDYLHRAQAIQVLEQAEALPAEPPAPAL